MIKFNYNVLADLITQGYHYMAYVGKGNYGLLKPLREPVADEFLQSIGGWQVAINEREIEEMASGVDVINFDFFVDENLFDAAAVS